MAGESAWQIEIPLGCARTNAGCLATLGGSEHLHFSVSNPELPSHPPKFRPGFNAVKINVGAEAKWIELDPYRRLNAANGGEIKERNVGFFDIPQRHPRSEHRAAGANAIGWMCKLMFEEQLSAV